MGEVQYNLANLGNFEEKVLMGIQMLKTGFWLFVLPFCVGSLFYYGWTHGRSFSRKFNKLPGPLTLPFVGCCYLMVNALDKIHYNIGLRAKQYKKNVRFWLAHIPYFITIDVDTIEKILSNPAHTAKSEAYSNSMFLVGHGLVTASVEKWKRDRRMLVPCLKSKMFEGYLENFNKNSRPLIDILKRNFPRGQEALDIREHFGRCTMDIVFETFMDIEFNLQLRPESMFYEAFTTCLDLAGKKMIQPWIRPSFMYKLLGYKKIQDDSMAVLKKAFDQDTIKEKIKEWQMMLEAEGDGMDTKKKLAHLLYLNRDDPEDIFHHFVTVMAGGFDTTSTVLNHTTYFLAANPEIQEKVREEINTVFDGDSERDLTFEDLSNMKYTEIVIKESMRMLTPTPILGRVLGEDLVLKNGLVVPKSANILIPTIHVHHDPDVWPEPEKFMPERFLPENSKGRSPYAFLPFSGGPRGCFAPKYAMMLIKVVLSRVVTNFEFSTEKRYQDSDIEYGVVTHIKGGLPVTLIPRKCKEY